MFQRFGLWMGPLHGMLCFIICCYNYKVHVCVLRVDRFVYIVPMVTVVLVSIVTVGYIHNMFRLVHW